MQVILLSVAASVQTSLDLDRVEVLHALFFALFVVFTLLVCCSIIVLQEGWHVALRNLVRAVKLLPRVVAHRLIHARLQAFTSLKDLIKAGLCVDSILILVDIDHLSTLSEITGLLPVAAIPHRFIVKLYVEATVIDTCEQS